MQILDDAERDAHRAQARAFALEATFIDTATSTADELRVVIPGFDAGEADWPAIGWEPRLDDDGELVYPHEGDEAAVTLTNTRRAWVLGWRPRP